MVERIELRVIAFAESLLRRHLQEDRLRGRFYGGQCNAACRREVANGFHIRIARIQKYRHRRQGGHAFHGTARFLP